MSHFRTLCALQILINQKGSVGSLSGMKADAAAVLVVVTLSGTDVCF